MSEVKIQRNDVIEKLKEEIKSKNTMIQSIQMKLYNFTQNPSSEKKSIRFEENKDDNSDIQINEESKGIKRHMRRKTESSLNIASNFELTPAKSKIKSKRSSNFIKINTFNTDFKQDKYKFGFEATAENYFKMMDQTLSLSQSELNLLSMTTQCFDKMINYSNSSECLKYIVSKICDFLLFERCYVMLIDIGNSKLRQISDPSSMDINFNEKTISKLFKDCIEDKKILDFDTTNTSQFEYVINKHFQFKPRDLMVVPILDKDKRNCKGVLLLANSIESSEVQHFSDTCKFKAYYCSLILNIYFEISYRQKLIEATQDKRNKINMAYSDMLNCYRTCHLTEYVESKLCELFDVHRINFLLCDHRRNELYKIVSDGKTHQQTIISYDSEKGLAKAVANDGIPNIANNAQCSKKFLALVDDPKGEHCADPSQDKHQTSILSIPVYKLNDNLVSANCIAVLQLINKGDGTPFTEDDVEDVKEFCRCFGDIVTNVYKVEQLFTFKGIMRHLETVLEKVSNEIQISCSQHDELKKCMGELRKSIKSCVAKNKN